MRSVAVHLLAGLLAGPAGAAVDLVWHAETLRGETIASRRADEPINPASVLKIATTLWALEELGPDHRFVTRLRGRGEVDADGVLRGDLIVEGGGDPDFHVENAFLLAGALNREGILQVSGRILAGDRFWIGWERGAGDETADPAARATKMAARLRDALDPDRWGPDVRRTWEEFADRRGLDPSHPPRLSVQGRAGRVDPMPLDRVLVRHRSKSLAVTLRRFNCYSNNDIERIGELLGGPAALETWLVDRLEADHRLVRVETTSGLGANRLTARLVVRLLREFLHSCDRMGLRPALLLPVAGCDKGTLDDSFPRLTTGRDATAVVGKTGTLLRTDGGVAALAGYARTERGERLFCIVAPRSGGRILEARGAEEGWVLDLLGGGGGPHPRTCPSPLPMPDVGATILVASPSE